MATKTTDTTRRRRTTASKAKTRPTAVTPVSELTAAIAAWERIATPVTDPDPCPVAWCVDCVSPDTASTMHADEGALHGSAIATVETISFNGIVSDLPREVDERQLRVRVERFDASDGGILEPANVAFHFGRRRLACISAPKAQEIAAALDKARVSALELAARTSAVAGATGAVSVIRADRSLMHVGAILTADGPCVFINSDDALDAGEVRRIARREAQTFRPDSWDMSPTAAEQLAGALTAAAVLTYTDHRACAAPTCPTWCANHIADPDGSTCHEGAAVEVNVTGDQTLVGGVVTLKLSRYDEPGQIGAVAVCLQSSQDGIDLSPTELRIVAAFAEQLATSAEATR